MGIGDWGLGIGDWGLGIGPNPQSPIPNPQSPIPKKDIHSYLIKLYIITNIKLMIDYYIFLISNNEVIFLNI